MVPLALRPCTRQLGRGPAPAAAGPVPPCFSSTIVRIQASRSRHVQKPSALSMRIRPTRTAIEAGGIDRAAARRQELAVRADLRNAAVPTPAPRGDGRQIRICGRWRKKGRTRAAAASSPRLHPFDQKRNRRSSMETAASPFAVEEEMDGLVTSPTIEAAAARWTSRARGRRADRDPTVVGTRGSANRSRCQLQRQHAVEQFAVAIADHKNERRGSDGRNRGGAVSS